MFINDDVYCFFMHNAFQFIPLSSTINLNKAPQGRFCAASSFLAHYKSNLRRTLLSQNLKYFRSLLSLEFFSEPSKFLLTISHSHKWRPIGGTTDPLEIQTNKRNRKPGISQFLYSEGNYTSQ